ncbi:hypothetical protein BDY19DRAFT_911925, partial [Irpex rosettiformis]
MPEPTESNHLILALWILPTLPPHSSGRHDEDRRLLFDVDWNFGAENVPKYQWDIPRWTTKTLPIHQYPILVSLATLIGPYEARAGDPLNEQ